MGRNKYQNKQPTTAFVYIKYILNNRYTKKREIRYIKY